MTNDPFHDLDAYIRLPRLGDLALSPDGERLVVAVSAPNADVTEYTTAIWELDPAGEEKARRITRSVKGEALAAFTRDGTLLFTSKRDIPAESEEKPSETTSAIWSLPRAGGEAEVFAKRDGGYEFVLTAADSGTVVTGPKMFAGVADDEEDAKKRKERKDKKVNAILHTASRVRYWDHDLGPESTRLRVGDKELVGDVGRAIASATLSPDGNTVAISWRVDDPMGEVRMELVLVDVATGERRTLAGEPGHDYYAPVFSRDSKKLVVIEGDEPGPRLAPKQRLKLFDVASGESRVLAEDWDRWGDPACFSPDGNALYVTADDDGHGPIFAIDVETSVVRRMTEDGFHTSVHVHPEGHTLYAVRSSYLNPGEIVAIDVESGESRTLPAPVEYPKVPGTLERVETTADDGTRVPGWLVLPESTSADNPAPLTLWVHGGPVASWNAWSWRWCPWLLASRGQAVLLPDPALSTGYGWDFIQRGFSHWGAEPFTDVMALTDAIEARDDIRDDESVMMGGSFGGYMANWIATQTDRFKAIVSHASLWNLESFGPTTDGPSYWRKGFTPQMLEEFSPHRHADKIVTPMLVIHGDKDYRVPIGEGLALWWALTGSNDGPPQDLPHQFLYYPDENHWILTPQHAKIWYETVIEFVAAHREGRKPERGALL